ncbi:DUF6495 family protein [Portibacter marinus]|uniref:DUF6495 family protein n=1 Tax=Portibacter marinus TaxID=2898660 RepID=UPI001F1C7556|nr:DUF6495 family protein [Portibacter marinus]
MAKYRLLTDEELKGLEKEFIDYLVINGITATDWVKMKIDQPDEAQKIVNLFSDVVFEKILRNVTHLEVHEKNAIRSFHCGEQEIHLITMELDDPLADFRDAAYIAQAMRSPPEDLLIYKTKKPYQDIRETEIFNMIEKGCLVSNGNLHKTLEIALEQT